MNTGEGIYYAILYNFQAHIKRRLICVRVTTGSERERERMLTFFSSKVRRKKNIWEGRGSKFVWCQIELLIFFTLLFSFPSNKLFSHRYDPFLSESDVVKFFFIQFSAQFSFAH